MRPTLDDWQTALIARDTVYAQLFFAAALLYITWRLLPARWQHSAVLIAGSGAFIGLLAVGCWELWKIT